MDFRSNHRVRMATVRAEAQARFVGVLPGGRGDEGLPGDGAAASILASSFTAASIDATRTKTTIFGAAGISAA